MHQTNKLEDKSITSGNLLAKRKLLQGEENTVMTGFGMLGTFCINFIYTPKSLQSFRTANNRQETYSWYS